MSTDDKHRATRKVEQILIVAPPTATIQIASADRCPTYLFDSVAALSAWLQSEATNDSTIDVFVQQALREIGVDGDELSDDLLRVLKTLGASATVPALKRVVEHSRSPRSFYRDWKASIAESPTDFLNRVRVLHAAALISNGVSVRDAAMRAGFRSVRAFNAIAARCGSK